VVQDRSSLALFRAARLEQPTFSAVWDAAVAEERAGWGAELRAALGRVSDAERSSLAFRRLAGELESDQTQPSAHAIAPWVANVDLSNTPELARVVQDFTARGRELEARFVWLQNGTSPEELEALDPLRDSDRIYHSLLGTFRVEGRVVETLAINRVATWESLALFLRSTREAERRPLPRFLDTYALFANFFEWGEQSQRGGAAIRRINQIHGRYYLPNEGMKYVLLNTAFTWLDGIDRIGHRPLSALERRGFLEAHLRLGRAMHIRELDADASALEEWFRQINRSNARHTPFKTETFETFVGNSFGQATEERDALLLAARAAMDDDYRAALGYAAPSADELRRVRGAVQAAVARARELCVPCYVRSLERVPQCEEPKKPAQLGVDARSPALPQANPFAHNAGYPDTQRPVSHSSSAQGMDLPVYAWSEVRQHDGGDSTWIVIDGEVYDVSGWLEHHPGGAERLRQWGGRDASRAFREVAHSQLTHVFRLNYRVGRVLEAEPVP
jgi:predicted heme/steroid binding protein